MVLLPWFRPYIEICHPMLQVAFRCFNTTTYDLRIGGVESKLLRLSIGCGTESPDARAS